jgi:CDP-2,3-bis-(O-geranylgeranyl)-sn-glycerol synthase
MSHDILFSLWFFLPAGVANVTPILVSRLPFLKYWNAPLDSGKQFRKKRIFGTHKTWRGLVCGVLFGTLVACFQVLLYRHFQDVRTIAAPLSYSNDTALILGALLSLGALIGDSIESFMKRQIEVSDGKSWFPFDQLDYVIGGLLLATVYTRLPAIDYVLIVIVWFVLHIVFSYLGYKLYLKAEPI